MRIRYIDVLKAFAIIAVVLYHAGFMTYGYLGVDLFLVISGYLTTKGLWSKVLINNKCFGGYVGFEVSRVIRLLPPLLVAGLFCMLLGYFVMLPDDYENLSESVIATNGFANNILAAITVKDYWNVANEFKPLMHTWYVGVVMQFYILYPILFYFAKLDKKNPKKTLLTMIGVLAVISLLIYFGEIDEAKRFYYLPTRFFEFAVGGIIALTYAPPKNKPFGKVFVYACYLLLLALIALNNELMPSNIKLVCIVSLSAVLLCSQDVLENKTTGNKILAVIGAASYSVFIWHQIVLAFCRYFITTNFTLIVSILLLFITALLSWLSYTFIEQGTTKALKSRSGKAVLYSSTALIFLTLSVFAGYIYLRSGVVRDVPELYINKNDIHRDMHAEYVDRAYQYDSPFIEEKKHWYVIGDSFGRDIVNIVLESSVTDSVELSYSTVENFKKENERFEKADVIFIALSTIKDEIISEVETMCILNGFPLGKLVIVGEKNFGVSNGQVYAKRNRPDYFTQTIDVQDFNRYIVENGKRAVYYGERYLNMMALVTDKNGKVKVFSPDHHFISADCRHLSKGGAIYYAQMIDWSRFLNAKD